MQTILGAGGVIGKGLALALRAYTDQVRLVSRKPLDTQPGETWMQADLTQRETVLQAVAGSEVVYLVAGIRYHTDTWRHQWPVIMQNVLEACEAHQAKLVFFDNVYAYGKVDGWMTEESPLQPCSKKGEVRRQVAHMLMSRVKEGRVNALIARAADFYGPDAPLSFTQIMVFDRLAKGKKPQWLITGKNVHSFTYTPDAAKASALLGNTASAYGQVWHLPNDPEMITGKQFLARAAKAFDRPEGAQILPAWAVRLVGLFNEPLKESIEMLYQLDSDYCFSSQKFFDAFPAFAWKTYDEGLAEIAQWYKKQQA